MGLRFVKNIQSSVLAPNLIANIRYPLKNKKAILHFRDFQHTFINNTNFNNFLTNNRINNCFSASFTLSSLKVEHRCYA